MPTVFDRRARPASCTAGSSSTPSCRSTPSRSTSTPWSPRPATAPCPASPSRWCPALLAARSVLRPVRDLRRAAAGIGRRRARHPYRGARHPTNSPNWPDLQRVGHQLEQSVRELQRGRGNAPAASPPTSRTNCAPRSPGCSPSPKSSTRTPPSLNADTARGGPADQCGDREAGHARRGPDGDLPLRRAAAELHLDEVDVAETIRKTLQAGTGTTTGRHRTPRRGAGGCSTRPAST